MGQNWGQVQGGPSYYDVSLDLPADRTGDSLSIYVSDLDAAARWEILVYANVLEGQFRVGQVTTRAPAAGDPFARLVACAHAPGARSWKISARSLDPAADYQCGITLASSPVSSLAAVGVTGVHHGDIPSGPRSYYDAGPVSVGAPTQIAPANVSAYTVTGTFDQADTNNAGCWIFLFDSLTAPNAASQPIWSQHVGQTAANHPADGCNWSYDGGPFGRLIQYGLWVATSSTPDFWTASPYTTDVHATFARV